MKRILVIGSGGREHTLAWSLARSKRVGKVFCAPGNGGTASVAENVPVPVKPPFEALIGFAREAGVDLTVVGPEQPLVDGIVDAFEAAGLRIFGPRMAAARLEGSKAFAKEVMQSAGIPTGRAETFSRLDQALRYVRSRKPPIVVKADGLAAGKGVTVAATAEEAETAVRASLEEKAFGASGNTVLIEEFLEGEEASILAVCDGEDVTLLPSSQDHKRIGEGDRGPNTGGMGAYSPSPVVTEAIEKRILGEIILPTVAEMKRRGTPYRGILYAGLMITPEGPKVIEYNCRLGDPETQAVLPRIEGDTLLDLLEASIEGRVGGLKWEIRKDPAVCVVAASRGYPGNYEKGIPITGIGEAEQIEGVVVFHAGTERSSGTLVTSGGRVLGVTAVRPTLRNAVKAAYEAMARIQFTGIMYRSDIAYRALR